MLIDFRDINDIEGSASLIFSMANTPDATSLIPGATSTLSPAKAAREWVKGVKHHIGTMPAGNAMRATGCLDLMHRLAYGKPADSSLLDTYRLAAFDSFVRGDSSVDRYILFNVVSSEVKQRNHKFFGKPLQWESLCIDRWHRQFRHGVCIDDLSDLDTVRRVTALLSSDLWAFETKNESRFKQTLFENHQHYLESIHNAQCRMHNVKAMHNVKSMQNAQCIMQNVKAMHNAESIHNAQCRMHNVKAMHNAESMHNAQCIMHNVKAMHNAESIQNAKFIMQNESQAESSDYALCIMNYELINALSSLLLASTPYLSPEEYTTYDTQIRTALYNHPATNRYHREALLLYSSQ